MNPSANRVNLLLLSVLLPCYCGVRSACAEVKLPSLISDRMVLQQGMPVAVWGKAEPGESITVEFRGQKSGDTAGQDGNWRVWLLPLEAGGPFEMKISGKNEITLKEIMVGEVWVCSGQSNMEWQVARALNGEQEAAQADNPEISLFKVKHAVSNTPQDDFSGKWEIASPESVSTFSAVGYFFGREIQQTRKVAVGLIESDWGGTPAESWTSEPALRADRNLEPILWQWQRAMAEYPAAKQRFDQRVKEYLELSEIAQSAGKKLPVRPVPPRGPRDPWTPSGLYNAMIAPMTSFAIRGAIWYQGESNASPYRAFEYRALFQTMIEGWRKAWGQPLPFLFVQLANYMERRSDPGESAWAELRESQTAALGLPNTGMAVAIDIGEADNIHPRNKQEVARRLCLAARAVAYGEDTTPSGPIYAGMTLEGKQIRVRFRYAGNGLKSRGDRIEGFAIAGRDRRFVWADARIEGGTVVVSASSVPDPVAVRYAWADNPVCNLYNSEGLPASPFRTDSWPGTTTPVP